MAKKEWKLTINFVWDEKRSIIKSKGKNSFYEHTAKTV